MNLYLPNADFMSANWPIHLWDDWVTMEFNEIQPDLDFDFKVLKVIEDTTYLKIKVIFQPQ